MPKKIEKFTQGFVRRFLLGGSDGFTLAELVVTVGIMTVVSSLILYENSKFNSSILLTNLAYEAALVTRQAQVFGLSSRVAPSGGATNIGYGVYFDVSSPAPQTQFIFFADTNNAPGYKDSFQPEEIVNIIGITNRNYVSDICRYISTDPPLTRFKCAIANADDTLEKVSIAFLRPEPEPTFKYESSVPSYNTLVADYLVIFFRTFGNAIDKRCLVVTNAGQISVKSQDACIP